MKGQILNFSFQTNSGAVSGDDGNRYSFTGANWQGADFPQRGMHVDFEPDGNVATDIYPDAGASSVDSPAVAPGAAMGGRVNASTETGRQLLAAGLGAANTYAAMSFSFFRRIPMMWLIIGGASGGAALLAVIVVVVLLATEVIGGGNPQPASVLDLVPEDASTIIRFDVQKVLDDDYLSDEWDLEDFDQLDDLGISVDDVSHLVSVDEFDPSGIVIFQGSFDLNVLREEMEDRDGEKESYRGYEVWEDVDGDRAVALLKDYVIMSGSVRTVENVLKNLYGGAGSLQRAGNDNSLYQVLDKLGSGYLVYAEQGRSCRVDECEGFGIVLSEVDDEDEEIKLEIALLFRNERSAERAADDYDEVADFLEDAEDIDIEDTEADGKFVVGVAIQDFQ